MFKTKRFRDFKINKSAFLDGFTSFTLFPKKIEKPAKKNENPWEKVWESFVIVYNNIGNIIYDQTK